MKKVKNKFDFPCLVNLIIASIASIILFSVAHNYSLEFFTSYVFFLLGGYGAYVASKNWSEKHRNSFPISTTFLVICYLYWAFSLALSFAIGVLCDLSIKLFLLLEFLSLAIGALLVTVFQIISAKYEKDDEEVRIRDVEINEISHHIVALNEKATALNEKIQPSVCSKIAALKKAFKFSEIMSQHYTAEMLQSIYDGLTMIEIEVDAALNIQPDEATGLENAITCLITTIKNNDEVCKASKR